MNFIGYNDWSESNWTIHTSMTDDITNDNLDLLVVPQHGRNPDYTG